MQLVKYQTGGTQSIMQLNIGRTGPIVISLYNIVPTDLQNQENAIIQVNYSSKLTKKHI